MIECGGDGTRKNPSSKTDQLVKTIWVNLLKELLIFTLLIPGFFFFFFLSSFYLFIYFFRDYAAHSFRRTGASIMAENGANTEELMSGGGWSSHKVARSYVDDSQLASRKRASYLELEEDRPAPKPAKRAKTVDDTSDPDPEATNRMFQGCTFHGPVYLSGPGN
jgi:hypothetical protein